MPNDHDNDFMGGGPKFNTVGRNTAPSNAKSGRSSVRLSKSTQVRSAIIVLILIVAAMMAYKASDFGLGGVYHKPMVRRDVDSTPSLNPDNINRP